MNWASRLDSALKENKFILYAQPIVPTKENTLQKLSYEVLIRMLDGEKIIPPGAFLPAAERYNKIVDIDRWVVSNTFSMISKNNVFLEQIDHVSINLSGMSLTNQSFMNFLVDQISTFNLHKKICFEITETAAISNLKEAAEFIDVLRKMGVRFSLDDFGSGLSSFAYLKNLNVDYLKIDGHFVKDIATAPIDKAMVKSIHEVASVMNKETIAEFVEDDEILKILQDLGINYSQGYGIGKPEPLTKLLNESN